MEILPAHGEVGPPTNIRKETGDASWIDPANDQDQNCAVQQPTRSESHISHHFCEVQPEVTDIVNHQDKQPNVAHARIITEKDKG